MRRFAILAVTNILLSGLLAAQAGKAPNTPVFTGLPEKTTKSDLRTIHGQILENDTPLEKSVVYLKNVRTLKIVTFITGKDGTYHFNGLNPNVDYEIRAEAENHRALTATHTVSLLDGRKDVPLNLRIDPKKKPTDAKPDETKKPDDAAPDAKKKPGA